MKTVINKEKKDCSGCSACKFICPTNSITQQADEYGFLYPVIRIDNCTNCGLCIKVCSFKSNYPLPQNYSEQFFYAVKVKDLSVRLSSRSGGFFYTLAKYVLDNKGIVYGVQINNNLIVEHIRIREKNELFKLQGSKYVQSAINESFEEVLNDLKENKSVLFSGTPCQTAGLISLIRNQSIDDSKLLICDIVCHGVPSPLIWNENTKYIEKKNNINIKRVNFRDKKYGWRNHVETYNDTYSYKLFTELYHQSLIIRESCGNCKYTNFNRPSDLTLADGWGLEKYFNDFIDDKGVSLIIVNTKKGNDYFNEINENLNYIKIKKEIIDQVSHPNLFKPTMLSNKRMRFWKLYFKHGYKYIIKKYTSCGLVFKIIRHTKYRLGLLK